MTQLDGLRALAVLGVIVHHTLSHEAIALLGQPGTVGVYLFFVLSGFLITGILLRSREQALKAGEGRGGVLRAFYARRFLRIFPLYYAVLALALAVNLPGMRAASAWYLAYAANFHIFREGEWGSMGHFWSLAVEEQFYLVWPAIVLFAPRRWLAPLFVTAVVSAPVFRLIAYSFTPTHFVEILTPACLDALGLGSLLALLWQAWGPGRRTGRWCAAALAVGLPAYAALQVPAVKETVPEALTICLRNTSLALAGVWVVHQGARGFRGLAGAALSSRLLTYLGTISYGVYVLHHPLLAVYWYASARHHLRLPSLGNPQLTLFVWLTVLTVAAASLSWFLFERPINNLKRYFPYVRTRRVASGT